MKPLLAKEHPLTMAKSAAIAISPGKVNLSGNLGQWMMLVLLILAASTGLHGSRIASAQTPIPIDELGPPPPPAKPARGAGPVIVFESLGHDWGTVLQGTVVEHTYKFRNTGSDVLRITNVKPG